MSVTTAGACCMGSVASMLTSCSTTLSVTASRNGNILKVNNTDFNGAKAILVNASNLKAPVYVLKTENDSYFASEMLCTHKLCELRISGPLLTCPCHGSEFNNKGVVLKGPAEQNLLSYPVRTHENYIEIEIIKS